MAASSQLVTLCTKTGWMMAPTRPMEKPAMKRRLKRLVSRSATKIQSPVPSSTNIRARTASAAGTASIGDYSSSGESSSRA